MSQFDANLSAGLATVRRLAGSQVVYHAGELAITIAETTQGETKYESIDEAGTAVRAIATDFMFAVADLVSGNQPIEPTPGHWIEKNGIRHEVANLGPEPCYRYSDPERTEYRVHTKQAPA